MPSRGPSSPSPQPGIKRRRQLSEHDSPTSPGQASPPTAERQPYRLGPGPALALEATTSKPGQSSNFRNVSACNRCRLRKNRCDQKLPSCASCVKAGVSCVGYDPITKKEIPRSYVYYLETRVEQLERLLVDKHISLPSAENLHLCSRPATDPVPLPSHDSRERRPTAAHEAPYEPPNQALESLKAKRAGQSPAMLNIVSPAKSRSLASASGVSFAKVVFAAVQYSVSNQNSHGSASEKPSNGHASGGAASMRDSFFGLHTKPTIQPAPFPDKDSGLRLATLYFEHANPQMPILHRGDFMQVFEQAYEGLDHISSRHLYFLNMVFAIGCGVIIGDPVKTESCDKSATRRHAGRPIQPEEYHASAIVHLESCLSFGGGGLEVLQAVLLLANFALLRPVSPGLWYITGVAVRLAVDLGLHHEDATYDQAMSSASPSADGPAAPMPCHDDLHEHGRRQRNRDMRRRLWWCTYSFDRLVSTCVGRPFGLSDEVITTELPSLLDDDFITPTGFVEPPYGDLHPSYKHVAHHYFRLRKLQSEMIQVLQFNQAQMTRAGRGNYWRSYPEMRHNTPSPFLVGFDSFRTWRLDIDKRLLLWKKSAPTRNETGVAFSTEFLELNYWQAIIMLYRQSLSVPAMFEGEYNPSDEVSSPAAFMAELREDEDQIYIKVAEAGQKILRIYRQLHLSGLVSYTYLSTHHLFMAGISYLYAIWHSAVVRSRLTMDEVDFTILAAKSVFTDMIDKCPPAETCRDAFDRTAKATIKMASSCGGFGFHAPPPPHQQVRERSSWTPTPDSLNRTSDRTPFRFDPASAQENMSSPGLSNGRVQTPPVGKTRPFESDSGYTAPGARSCSLDNHDAREDSIGQAAESSSIDPSLVSSPSLAQQSGMQHASVSDSSFMGHPFGTLGPMDYPDARTMDFLRNLGAASGGSANGIDQTQLDMGLDMNWERMYTESVEGQAVNPFDSFFFGGQQNSAGG
ncbi:hypothetical protein CDD82_3758 [Ophiocordyceps australis]|uniref:Zn(2)-C6 fungal-type domain-containing protein n=1 Tax=Ophiocordyceps australis TaxID=1399860 RepID=A0A2C5ZA68_9HYPO|nr:hypothetical protein CDD82_3758 [Ophiocordyceps australis]